MYKNRNDFPGSSESLYNDCPSDFRYPVPAPNKKDTQELLRTLLLLWAFLLSEGLWDDALSFIEEREEAPMPFDLKMLHDYFLL